MSALHQACTQSHGSGSARRRGRALQQAAQIASLGRHGTPALWTVRWRVRAQSAPARASHLHKGPPQDGVGDVGKPERFEVPAQEMQECQVCDRCPQAFWDADCHEGKLCSEAALCRNLSRQQARPAASAHSQIRSNPIATAVSPSGRSRADDTALGPTKGPAACAHLGVRT